MWQWFKLREAIHIFQKLKKICAEREVRIVIETVLHLGNSTFLMARFMHHNFLLLFCEAKGPCIFNLSTSWYGHFNSLTGLSSRKAKTQIAGWMDPTANSNLVVRWRVPVANSKHAPLVQTISLKKELSAFIPWSTEVITGLRADFLSPWSLDTKQECKLHTLQHSI